MVYQVWRHNVGLVAQRTNNTCWYAAMLMVVRHHRRYLEIKEGLFYRILSGDPEAQKSGPGADLDTPEVASAVEGGMFDASKTLSASAVESMAIAAHLKAEHIALTPEEVSRVLHDSGPIVYGGKVQGYREMTQLRGHAVVITGISGPERSPILELNDPWPIAKGTRLTYQFAAFIRDLKAYPDSSGKAVVVHV